MLTNDEICAFIENAFLPNRCVAEIWDYNKKLRFKVFDAEGNSVATLAEAVLASLRETRDLESLIQSVRLRIEHKD